MALKATIFKASVQVSDMDRNYYATHALTLARHPSETDERMMVRLLAFALHAEERLEFGKGVSDDSRSLAFRIRLQAPDRTLTDEEVATARQKSIDAVAKLGAQLRA